jgi:trigger factor
MYNKLAGKIFLMEKTMKKKLISIILCTTMALALCACGDKTDGSGTGSTVTSSGTKVETDYGMVTLCDYIGLAADETHYEISDDEVDEQVNDLLYDYVEYTDKETAEDGDYVEAYVTGTADGDLILDYSEETGDAYEILLGYYEFGEEFDEKLLGVSAGDELSFSVTYDEDYGDDDYAGKTVSFEVTVVAVYEETLPELTEDFVVNTLGYESEEAMRSELREQLEEYYNSDSAYYAKEDLIGLVVENSEFDDYSEEAYAAAKEDVEASYEEYMDWIGASTVEEVYEVFGISSEDVEAEALQQVYRTIAVYAIAQEQGLDITDDEYQSGLEKYAQSYTDYYGEEYTTDDLVSEVGEETLRYWVLEDKVLDYLYDNAVITQVEGSLDLSDEDVEAETDEE